MSTRSGIAWTFFEMLARRRVWQTATLVALSELAVIGTAASAISRDQLAYASKDFLEFHAANQSFFLTNSLQSCLLPTTHLKTRAIVAVRLNRSPSDAL